MISRRKFLQGALGFASAAIIPAGVIMPIKSEIEEPQIVRFSSLKFYPNPEDDYIYGTDLDDPRIQSILDVQKIMDKANVPEPERGIIWVPQQGFYVDNLDMG